MHLSRLQPRGKALMILALDESLGIAFLLGEEVWKVHYKDWAYLKK
jgi:hypothetical protein